MKIKWYGHAAFRLITAQGLTIIIDPYEPGAFGGALSYGRIAEAADIVLTSHDHEDHNYIKDIQGNFIHINKEGAHTAKGVKIDAIATFHDPSKGKERGKNLIFRIEADGLVVVHAGDLGHPVGDDVLKRLGDVSVLLLPVGGFYTIDASEAAGVMNAIDPAITIPMHYKTEKCAFPIARVEDFTSDRGNVKWTDVTEIEVTAENLPAEPKIVVLKHAL